MAVYTKINQSDIDIINNKFNIEKILVDINNNSFYELLPFHLRNLQGDQSDRPV